MCLALTPTLSPDTPKRIIEGAASAELPVIFESPNTNHEDSDDCAAVILDHLDDPSLSRPLYDDLGGRMNAIRTRTMIFGADVVVARFDNNKYRQW